MFRPSRLVFFASLALCVAMTSEGVALPGQVSIRDGIIQWGQYNNIKHVIAVGASTENLAETIRDYPVSGASCVLIHAQRPGEKVFSSDGSTIETEAQTRLLEDIRAANLFDMLPIVVLFRSDADCHLQSPNAYASAAGTLTRLVDEAKLWYLPCIVADGASEDWGTLDASAIVTRSASAFRAVRPQQVIAAGSSDAAFNQSLFKASSPIGVLMAYSSTAGALTQVDNHPFVEVLAEGNAEPESFWPSLEKTYGQPKYGFAIDLEDGETTDVLNGLFALTDRYHKSAWTAVAPDPADTHSLKPGEAEEGFRSLFNGVNLNGWVQLSGAGNFVVKDGAIELVGKTGGWLRSWEPYGDFVYRGEYWIEEGGNAGFYIRAPAIGRQSRIGFEFQIMGQPASLKPRKDTTGAIYDVRPPDGNFMKAGDWNEVEIRCEGSHVRIVWNGQLAHDFHYEEIDFMGNRAHRGFIGLQDHQSSVKYRNLRIKRLNGD